MDWCEKAKAAAAAEVKAHRAGKNCRKAEEEYTEKEEEKKHRQVICAEMSKAWLRATARQALHALTTA